MTNIVDVSLWHEFRIGDLFDVSRPIPRIDKTYDSGAMPYVASGNVNNGVMSYLRPKSDDDYDMGNCITVSPVDGCAFYQKDNFLGRGGAGSSIIILRSDMLTELTGLFLSTVIRGVCSDWSYSNMGNKDILADMKIKLPVTPEGEPDWAYMEQYMKAVMDRQAHVIDSLTRISKEKHPVDVSAWGEFRVGELFDVQRGQRHVLNNHEPGDIPYYSASLVNNGVTDLIGNPLFVANDAIVVTTFGDAFWADGNFTASDECSILKHSDMNELSGLFVATAYMAHNKRKYSFKLKAFSGRVAEDVVFLPVTPSGEPDWSYMEQYMRTVMDRQSHVVRCLARLRG